MKIIIFLITVCMIQISAASHAQHLTIKRNSATLREIFTEIQKQTDYSIVYYTETIKHVQPIHVDLYQVPIETALAKIFENQFIDFIIEGNEIVLSPKPLKVSVNRKLSQETIRGRVIDALGKPLLRASVRFKGEQTYTLTDQDGYFILPTSPRTEILVVSYVGFQVQELAVYENMIVHMLPISSPLDEIQVIGYGTTTQRFNVGSVTTVKAEDIQNLPVSNPLATLQGRVPGLVIQSTSGLPGAAFKVQIRGQNTLAPNIMGSFRPMDQPLFIIDGVPFAPQNNSFNLFNSIATQGISPFNGINPSDIESIEVLRDADATAIYGSRGGHGVILITTKKGNSTDGKTEFNMNAITGVSMIGKTMSMMNTEQYLDMRREAIANEGLTPNLTILHEGYAPDVLLFDPERNTDWKDFFLGNTAQNTLINTSLSGGTDRTHFRLGSGFNHSTFVFPGGFSDKRGSFAMNVNHRSIDRKFSINFSSLFAYNENNSSGTPDLLTAYRLPPNFPDFIDSQGNLLWEYKGMPFGLASTDNPMTYLRNTYKIHAVTLNNSLLINYEIIEGLILKTSFGYNSVKGKEYKGMPRAAKNPIFGNNATASFGNNDLSTWIVEPHINYQKSLGKNKIDLLFGATLQRQTGDRVEMTGSGYSHDNLIGSIAAATTKTVTDGSSQYKYAALFGRANYRWNDRYIANLNVRRDGSSRFGPGKQYGTFGSIGLGWLFTEEEFLQDKFSWLSFGKLRSSYGTTGSDAIGDYLFMPRWASSIYTYDGQPGYLPQNLYNSKLHWASTRKFETGLDLGLLGDRVLLNTSFYHNVSDNQLISYVLPFITGFGSVPQNWNATVENYGVEIVVNSKNLQTNHLKWNTSFNLTVPKNKLVRFPGITNSSYNSQYIVGKSVNTVLGFDYVEVNPTTGLFEFRTANGTLSSTPEMPSLGQLHDYIEIGNLDPKFYGGLLNSLTFKNLQFDIHIDFRKQMGVNYLHQVYGSMPGMAFNLPSTFVRRWQKPGDISEFQKFSTAYAEVFDTSRHFRNSSGAYSDASFIKIRNISLSYRLDELSKKMKIRGVTLYASAQNLWTMSRYKGIDPETQTIYGVPILRTITGGIQVSF